MLSGALDAHLDHYDSITTGHISRALHYLNIEDCQLSSSSAYSLVLVLLASCCNMPALRLAITTPNLFVVPVSLLFTIIAVHYTGKVVAPRIPRDHSSAITEEEYVGSMALITGHQATSGNPAKENSPINLAKYIICYWSLKKEKTFTKGDKVLIICRLSATRYLAENNPRPQIL